jgi:hypothetical protein
MLLARFGNPLATESPQIDPAPLSCYLGRCVPSLELWRPGPTPPRGSHMLYSDAEIDILFAQSESDLVERKRSTNLKDAILEAVCSFANDLPNHRKPGGHLHRS